MDAVSQAFATFIHAHVERIAADAGVSPTSVQISYHPTGDDEPMPWIVMIVMRAKTRGRPKFDNARGFGATIEEAGVMAISDIASFEKAGYVRDMPI